MTLNMIVAFLAIGFITIAMLTLLNWVLSLMISNYDKPILIYYAVDLQGRLHEIKSSQNNQYYPYTFGVGIRDKVVFQDLFDPKFPNVINAKNKIRQLMKTDLFLHIVYGSFGYSRNLALKHTPFIAEVNGINADEIIWRNSKGRSGEVRVEFSEVFEYITHSDEVPSDIKDGIVFNLEYFV